MEDLNEIAAAFAIALTFCLTGTAAVMAFIHYLDRKAVAYERKIKMNQPTITEVIAIADTLVKLRARCAAAKIVNPEIKLTDFCIYELPAITSRYSKLFDRYDTRPSQGEHNDQ